MRDTDMTKEQLISELTELRQQVETWRTEAPQRVGGSGEAQRSERLAVEAQIEFIRDFDIVEATGVDLSEGGICFDVSDTLCFDMKVTTPDEEEIHRGNLAWMRRLKDGRYRFGFEFVPTSQGRDS